MLKHVHINRTNHLSDKNIIDNTMSILKRITVAFVDGNTYVGYSMTAPPIKLRKPVGDIKRISHKTINLRDLGYRCLAKDLFDNTYDALRTTGCPYKYRSALWNAITGYSCGEILWKIVTPPFYRKTLDVEEMFERRCQQERFEKKMLDQRIYQQEKRMLDLLYPVTTITTAEQLQELWDAHDKVYFGTNNA
jgi:hypothetical protein